MTDFMYSLQATRGVLHKTFKRNPDDPKKPLKLNPDFPTTFLQTRHTVSSLEDLHVLLDALRPQRAMAVIRGEFIGPPNVPCNRYKRTLHPRKDIQPMWDQAAGHHWVCIDVDQFILSDVTPGDASYADDELFHLHAALTVRKALPEPFHRARALCHLSSSYGYGSDFSKFKGHLWFWFDRPVCDDSLKAWAALTEVADPKVFTCNQLHFTADPVFSGVRPFISEDQRLFVVGHTDPPLVIAPEFLTTRTVWEAQQAALRAAPRKPIVGRASTKAYAATIPVGSLKQEVQPHHIAYARKAVENILKEASSWQPGDRHTNIYKKCCHLMRLHNTGLLENPEDVALAMLKEAYHDLEVDKRNQEETTMEDAFDAAANEAYDLSKLITNDATESGPSYSSLAKTGKGPAFVDFDKKGKPTPTPANVKAVLDYEGVSVTYNLMTHRRTYGLKDREGIPRESLAETVLDGVDISLDRYGIYRSDNWTRKCLSQVQLGSVVHPAYAWMTSVPWDGVDRLEHLFETLRFADGTDESDLNLYRKLLRMWLISAARAAAVPAGADLGIAAQGMLILKGQQNAGKSRWIQSLCGYESAMSGQVIGSGKLSSLSNDQVRSCDKYLSRWIYEFAELDSSLKYVDEGDLKDFIDTNVDRWMPKYDTETRDYPRRTVFAGTLNPDTFLKDPTGNRRFWVLPVVGCSANRGMMPMSRTKRCIEDIDMQQLWAQVHHLEKSGEPHYVDEATLNAINEHNAMYDGSDFEGVDLTLLFDAAPKNARKSEWLTGAEARALLFTHMNIPLAAWQDSGPTTLWQRASNRIQKIWGDRVKYGTMRYPIVKRVTTV